MKINILSPGRFHVLDLARELDKNGFDVKFYSFVPTKRAVSFGLPAHCSASLFLPMLPFLALQKVFRGQQWAAQLRMWVQDRMTAWLMRKCDVLIAMSGDFIVAPRKAKRQGSKIIIERGSKHILAQKRILESIPSNAGKKPVPDANVRRELACYELADYISIASEHVRRSFVEEGFDVKKLFVNPYGVNLKDFYPMPSAKKVYDVIMVGGWSYRKGCDLILEAIKAMNLRFLHVGALVDLPFPQGDSMFSHVDAVEQRQLVGFYHRARVFLLPSREEGLAMVQAQAIACNLLVVGSPNSGAEDLQKMVAKPEFITLIRSFDTDSVKAALTEALEKADRLVHNRYAGHAIDGLTWEAYGKRYTQFLNSL